MCVFFEISLQFKYLQRAVRTPWNLLQCYSSLASTSTQLSTYPRGSTLLHKFVLNLGSAFCDIPRATAEVCAEVPGAVPPFPIFSAFIYSRSQTDQLATSAMSGP
ncbi:hypothetical protein B0H12DRAFT_1111971 [Mycena haematopus]|nr:hypothetical protein B0H12DRAFT_1111971 [Mycena haematopus]